MLFTLGQLLRARCGSSRECAGKVSFVELRDPESASVLQACPATRLQTLAPECFQCLS